MIPIPKRPIPAKDMASKFYRMSKQSAIDEIEFRRKGSVDTEYWDEVMRHTMDYFQSVENSERDKDAYYRNALSSDDRFRAGRIIDDLVVDPAHAYRGVGTSPFWIEDYFDIIKSALKFGHNATKFYAEEAPGTTGSEIITEPIYKVGKAFHELSDADKQIIVLEQHRQNKLNGGGGLR